MLDIPKVSKRILKTLEKEGWTLEKLAAASAEELTPIPGIGATTAWRIIVAARRERLAEKAARPSGGATISSAPRGLYLVPPGKPEPAWLKEGTVEELESMYLKFRPAAEIPAMSVRVKRNWLRRKLMELI